MKKLIIPIIIGLVAGLGGGSGFAYFQLSSRYVVDSTRVAREKAARDSVVADSVARDSVARDSVARDSAAHAAAGHDTAGHGADSAAGPLTPADSIRALQAARAALRGEGAPPHATEAPGKDTHAKDTHAKDAHAKAAPGTPTPAATGDKAPAVGAAKGVTKGATDEDPLARMVAAAPEVAAAMRDVRNTALKESIPEQRLASIFAAMRAKEAAKVLDQMSDRDVRTILGLMSDRKAAEILTLLAPARAAAVTRGTAKTPEVTP